MGDRGKFVIVTVEGHVYVKDFETREQANVSCIERNARAESLGIVARYIVVEE